MKSSKRSIHSTYINRFDIGDFSIMKLNCMKPDQGILKFLNYYSEAFKLITNDKKRSVQTKLDR